MGRRFHQGHGVYRALEAETGLRGPRLGDNEGTILVG
jgi:hypothetical protein